MSQNYKECIHSPGAGHQEMIWNKTLKMKEDGLNESKARELQMVEWDGYHIDVSTAIDRAVVRVYSENTGKAKKKKNWPKANKGEIQSIAEKNPCTLQELRKESPYPESKLKLIPTAAILQLSFPKGSLVCLGESVQSCSTKKVTEFCASNENLPFIVPRTMSEKFGTSQDGKKSPRCNENTGPERFIVIEFDDMEESVQISMIKYLSEFLPLVLVLHSGGKSFHAWFTGCGASEERVFAFRCRAASLGADRAVFTKSQMVRTPNQTRGKDGKLQELHYFDSSKLPISSGGAPSINFDQYPFCSRKKMLKSNDIKVPEIFSWKEFQVNCPPEPPEIIESFLHKGGKAVIGGSSKAGKSHLVMQLANAVATGSEFLGMETRKAEILYINLEIQPFALKKRIDALHAKQQINMEDGILHITNGRGCWSGVKSLDAMVDNMLELGIEMIIIDPLYKVEDMDESDQAKVKEILRTFDNIIEETGAALLYVHHYGKGKDNEKRVIDLLSGSGVLARDYDSAMFLINDNQGKSKLSFSLRNHEPKSDIPLRCNYPLKEVDDSRISTDGGSLRQIGIQERSKYEGFKVKDITAELKTDECISSKELRDKVEKRCGMKKSTFNKLVKQCKDEGLVHYQKKGREIFYSLPCNEFET